MKRTILLKNKDVTRYQLEDFTIVDQLAKDYWTRIRNIPRSILKLLRTHTEESRIKELDDKIGELNKSLELFIDGTSAHFEDITNYISAEYKIKGQRKTDCGNYKYELKVTRIDD